MNLDEIFLENPLVIGNNNLSLDNLKGGSVYLGTGLANPFFSSQEVPFDILSMIFSAEYFRVKFDMSKIFHVIADVHASINDSYDDSVVMKYLSFFDSVKSHLDLPNYEVILASEFNETKKYQDILKEVKGDDNYALFESADIEYFRRESNVSLKIGWSMGSNNIKYDERYFDNHYKNHFDSDLSLIYLESGKKYDGKSKNTTPYLFLPSDYDKRIHFGMNKNFSEFKNSLECSNKTEKYVDKYLSKILDLYDHLFGLPNDSFESNIDSILSSFSGNIPR